MTTKLLAILIGSPSSSNGADGIPVVVWSNQSRTRDSNGDPWKQTLTYYEFLDDPRWTHLDALLTRLAPISCLHVGSTENLTPSQPSSNTKNANSESSKGFSIHKRKTQHRMERLIQSLQTFVESRSDLCPPQQEQQDDESMTTTVECQLHLHVPVDGSRVDALVSQLLVDDPDTKLAYRGNTHLAHNTKLQQGLALWLRAQGLLSNQTARAGCDSDAVAGTFHLEAGFLTSHLTLDRTAAECIHLLPPATSGIATYVGGTMQNNSLLGILSQPCLTKMGKHKMELWLRQPLVQLEPILERQQAISALLGLGKDQVREALRSFTGLDLNKLATTLGLYANLEGDVGDDEGDDADPNGGAMMMGGLKTPLQAMYSLYMLASAKIPMLHEATDLTSEQHPELPQLLHEARQGLAKLSAELERCQGLVEAVLDLDQAPREFLVKASFKPELGHLKEELEEIQAQVKDEQETVQQTWNGRGNSSTVRLEQDEKDGTWQFRVPDQNDLKTVEALPKVQVHRVLKNGVYFSTKALRELSQKYQETMGDYQKHSRKVVRDAMAVATTYQPVVERAADIVATLDVLCSLAHVAAYSPHGYCKPTLTDSDEDGMGIQLKGARHPCVELQEGVDFIPNDISLVFGESNFLLVTGPNMGGKSTYIRAVGAIVTMAQIGSYVPCQSATVNICHSILARVGAGDLQERGISTFMAEMLEASSILRTATKRSLIVVDELGRGTSTFDGYGLARAISEYILRKIGCMVVFATHFHELTELEDSQVGVKNCHVTAHKGHHGLTFLYQVRPGPCLESFGIQVAEMANVPAVVIEDAKRKARLLENFQAQKRARRQVNDDDGDGCDDGIKFVQKFCSTDIPALLGQPYGSEEEKRAAILQALQVS